MCARAKGQRARVVRKNNDSPLMDAMKNKQINGQGKQVRIQFLGNATKISWFGNRDQTKPSFVEVSRGCNTFWRFERLLHGLNQRGYHVI